MIHTKKTIYRQVSLKDGIMEPGNFMFKLKFKLPEGIPSSCYFKESKSNNAQKAKVKYFVKVHFHRRKQQAEAFK